MFLTKISLLRVMAIVERFYIQAGFILSPYTAKINCKANHDRDDLYSGCCFRVVNLSDKVERRGDMILGL